MPLVPEFVYGLVGDDKTESAQITVPVGLQEAARHETTS